MPANKNQHYVPKFVLKSFANSKNMLVGYQRDSNRFINSMPYMSQCQNDYFYGKDGKMERFLADFEGDISSIIQKIINSKSINKLLNSDEYQTLYIFVMSQYFRTVGALERFKTTYGDMKKQVMPIIRQFHDYHEASETDEEAWDRNFPLPKNEEIIQDYIGLAITQLESYSDLQMLYIENKTNINFITSNDPVTVKNYYFPKNGYGIECSGILYFLPISPKKGLLLIDAALYFNLDDVKIHIEISNEVDILKMNSWLFTNSNLLYSIDKPSLERTVDRCLEYKKNNIIYAHKQIVKDLLKKQAFYSKSYFYEVAKIKMAGKFNEAISDYVENDNIPSFLRINLELKAISDTLFTAILRRNRQKK